MIGIIIAMAVFLNMTGAGMTCETLSHLWTWITSIFWAWLIWPVCIWFHCRKEEVWLRCTDDLYRYPDQNFTFWDGPWDYAWRGPYIEDSQDDELSC